MSEIKDEQLVASFLKGNEKGFEIILNRYLKPIYNFLYRLTRSPSSVDDLTQEVFIKVWRNLKRFDQTKSFKVWLYSIARNTAYDFLKKKKTIPFAFFDDREGNNRMNNIPDDNILPDELLSRADLSKEIEKYLKKIPQRYRIILTMRYKDDFSLTEISEILKIPYNTIKSQHQRGLQALKKTIIAP